MIRPSDVTTQVEIDLISEFVQTMSQFLVERAPLSWGIEERLIPSFRELVVAEINSLPPLILNIGDPLDAVRKQLFAIVEDLRLEMEAFPKDRLSQFDAPEFEWDSDSANEAITYITITTKLRFAALVLSFVQIF